MLLIKYGLEPRIRSSMVERMSYTHYVGGPNPPGSTRVKIGGDKHEQGESSW